MMDLQSILVILLILVAAAFLANKYFGKARSMVGKGNCESNCGCESGDTGHKNVI